MYLFFPHKVEFLSSTVSPAPLAFNYLLDGCVHCVIKLILTWWVLTHSGPARGTPGEPDRCEGETELLRWDGVPDNCSWLACGQRKCLPVLHCFGFQVIRCRGQGHSCRRVRSHALAATSLFDYEGRASIIDRAPSARCTSIAQPICASSRPEV